MQEIDQLIFNFAEHLKVLNRSPATIKHYLLHVSTFLREAKVTDIRHVTRTKIEAHLAAHSALSANSRSLKLRAVKRFFEYLHLAGRIFIDPAAGMPGIVQRRPLPKKVLTRQQTCRLLEMPDLATPLGIRDRAALELLDGCGLRAGELCSLKIEDIDFNASLLRINQGKGGKDRLVPLGQKAADAIRAYLNQVRPLYVKTVPGVVFIRKDGKPLSVNALQSLVRRYAAKAGIDRPVHPHLLRHGFATALFKNGAGISAVQLLLGHAQVKTTQVYLRSLGVDIKAVHAKAHPREKEPFFVDDITANIERIRPQHG